MASPKSFKIVLVGAGGVGKSTFVERHLTGKFETKYVPTMGVEVHPLTFNTSQGEITLNIWDCAGVEEFGGLHDGYYIGAAGVIGMYDLTNKCTLEQLPKFLIDVASVTPTAKVVTCGTRCDITKIDGRKVDFNKLMVEYREILGDKYMTWHISNKSNYQAERPFLYLMRALTNNPNLVFRCEQGRLKK